MIQSFKKLSVFLLCSMVLTGCSDEIFKDITYTQKTSPSLTTDKAKAWFETNFPLLKNANTFKIKGSDSTAFQLKPLLDWNLAEIDNDTLWSVVELPWAFENGKETMANSDVSAYANINQKEIKQVLRLVVMMNKKTGDKYGFKMAVIPDLDYMIQKGDELKSNNYFNRDAKLSGTVLFYSVYDEFINGWQYKNGKITGKIQARKDTETSNKNPKIAKVTSEIVVYEVTTCWWQVVIMGGYESGPKNYCETELYMVSFMHFDSEFDSGGAINFGSIGGGGGSIVPPIPLIQKNDCAGILNGVAFFDDCEECVGGTTGKSACNLCDEFAKELALVFKSNGYSALKSNSSSALPCAGTGKVYRNGQIVNWNSFSDNTTDKYGITTIFTKKQYNHLEGLLHLQHQRDSYSNISNFGLSGSAADITKFGMAALALSGSKLMKLLKEITKLDFACALTVGGLDLQLRLGSEFYGGVSDKLSILPADMGIYEMTTFTQKLDSMHLPITFTTVEYYTTDGCSLGQFAF